MNHNTNQNMPVYKIAKPILGFIYKLWYNPTIIGKDNILVLFIVHPFQLKKIIFQLKGLF